MSRRIDRTSCRNGIVLVLTVALCCGFGGSPVLAQVPTAPAPAAPPTANNTTEPTPAHVEAARQLILATGISRSFQIIIPGVMDSIGSTLSQTRPELAADLNTVLGDLKPEFDRQADEMIDLSARIYAHLLSEDDIKTIVAFYQSDAGKKYVNAQPHFFDQLVVGIQAWQQKISVNMMTRVREELKKKGHDL